MKLNQGLIASSISIGLLAGLWMVLGWLNAIYNPFFSSEHLISVAFLGWAIFYAIGGKVKGLINGLLTSFSGVFWGVFMSFTMGFIAGFFPSMVLVGQLIGGFIGIGLGSALVVLQAHVKRLSYIPAAFIGAAGFFAVGLGDYSWGGTLIQTLLGLAIGLTLGITSEVFTDGILKIIKK